MIETDKPLDEADWIRMDSCNYIMHTDFTLKESPRWNYESPRQISAEFDISPWQMDCSR